MDESNTQNTIIKINEIVLKENAEWLHFSEPLRIITAEKLADVLPALHDIEESIHFNNCHAAGFLSYEAAPAFDSALQTQPEAGFPYLWFGLYPKPQVITLPQSPHPPPMLEWQPTIDRNTYNSAIAQIKDHIAEGRTYQVNYTMRVQTKFTGDTWDFFLKLAKKQNKHAAYIDTGQFVICSASPELFFQLDGETIICRPMKGTTSRGRTTTEDKEQSDWLKNSAKNRAENVMIVDMVRNDLGRIAKIGSVKVPELFNTERYPTLWQMTSSVTAKTSASLTDIFRALFPSASITGAPKVGTTKVIAKLEATPRRIYTGSIGHISPRRKAKFNVAIRTVLIDRRAQQAEYGVGGGIVWDSTSEDEFAEALLKAQLLTEQPQIFSLLETLLWTPDEGFFLHKKHLARVLDSADYFDIPIIEEELEEYLKEISSKFNAPQRVRLLLAQTGTLHAEARLFKPDDAGQLLQACVARQAIDSSNVFLFHKTTRRDDYESARHGLEEFDDVLLYNQFGELTEFTLGNLVVELGGKLFTPPISCGVLPGTFRAHLVEAGRIVERKIPVEQLKECTQIFRINSVRKWQSTKILETPALLTT